MICLKSFLFHLYTYFFSSPKSVLKLSPDIISFNCYCKFLSLVGVSTRFLKDEEHVRRPLLKGIY